MADKKGIERLDEKLISSKIVSKQYKTDLPLVHRKMNSIIKKTGRVLSETVFETGNEALRKWLALLDKQGASQAKLTAYLRCGLAHLNYDYVESQYKKIGEDDLIARTLVSMKKRKFHNCFFKPQLESPVKPAAKKGAKGKKRIQPVLKTLAYKKASSKKPAAKKAKAGKPAARKTTARKAKKAAPRKTASKKVPARKPAARKSPARKASAKKTKSAKPAARKPAAKKKAVLKTLAYRKSPVRKPTVKKPAARKSASKKPKAKSSRKPNIVKAISRKAEALRAKVRKAVKAKKPASRKPKTVRVYSYGDRLTHLVK